MGSVDTDASYFQGRRTVIMLRSHDLFLLFRLVPQPYRRSHQTSQLKLKTFCVKPLKLITRQGPRRWNCYNIHGSPRKALTKLTKFQGRSLLVVVVSWAESY
jgi:hypothetical protein